jgi:hypothetical protein
VTRNSRGRLTVSTLAAAALVATTRIAASATHAEQPQWESGALVVSTEDHDDGSMTETIYTPAEGVSPAALVASLRAEGVANPRVETSADDASPQVIVTCRQGTARTWATARTCFVKWSKNGAAQPTIHLIDHSAGAWPVGRAASEWNKVSGIDTIYRPNGSMCEGGPEHCVHVWSGNYGKTTWIARTTRSVNAAKTYYTRASVKFNNYYLGSGPTSRWNAACHELGHVLGLSHNLSKSSCMYRIVSSTKKTHSTAEDRGLVERYY